MLIPGFCSGSYTSQSLLADQERTINLYSENMESPDATTRMALYPTPGVTRINQASGATGGLSGGAGSAHFAQDGREFVVVGGLFAEIGLNGNVIGSTFPVATNSNPATMCSNGKTGGQILITSGGNAYIFNMVSGAFTTVAALGGLATMGDQLDGYFLVLNSNTSTVYFSNLNDGLTWQTGTNFMKRGIASDPWFSMKVVNRYIWLLGTQTSEIWYDAGTFPIPFVPYTSAVVPYGCGAQFSPSVANGALTWLGSTTDGEQVVLQAQGFTANVISTYAMSNAMTGFSSTSDGIGDTYSSRGHTFYLLSLPIAGITLCYDFNTSLWHERGTWISERNSYVVWRPLYHAYVFNQHRILDSSTDAIYVMNETTRTDVDGRNIRWMRQAPGMFFQNERIFVNAFELFMEPGTASVLDSSKVPPDIAPEIMMQISNDGGKTWGNERLRGAGRIGEYQVRARWNRCGQARRMVFRVSGSDAIAWRIMGASAEIRQPPKGMSQYQATQWI